MYCSTVVVPLINPPADDECHYHIQLATQQVRPQHSHIGRSIQPYRSMRSCDIMLTDIWRSMAISSPWYSVFFSFWIEALSSCLVKGTSCSSQCGNRSLTWIVRTKCFENVKYLLAIQANAGMEMNAASCGFIVQHSDAVTIRYMDTCVSKGWHRYWYLIAGTRSKHWSKGSKKRKCLNKLGKENDH